MKSIAQLLDLKGREIWGVAPDASVYDGIKLMAEKGVGALLVMEGSRLVGIISERDYARKVILQGLSSRDTQIRAIMTTSVVYAEPDQTIEHCMALMTDKRIRHLPVMDGLQVLGVLSIGDLVKEVISEQQFTIEQLEQYINH